MQRHGVQHVQLNRNEPIDHHDGDNDKSQSLLSTNGKPPLTLSTVKIAEAVKPSRRAALCLLVILTASIVCSYCIYCMLLLNVQWSAVKPLLDRIGASSSLASSSCAVATSIPLQIHRNHQRWARVLEKLERGEPLIIGAIGGSVTVQYGGYPQQLMQLLTQRFPVNQTLVNLTRANGVEMAGNHQMYNQAAGGMTSDGISICLSNLFSNTHPTVPFPDIITIEFALNDGAGDHYAFSRNEADPQPMAAFRPEDNIERIARTLLGSHRIHNVTSNSQHEMNDLLDGPALMLVYFATTSMKTAQDRHALIGRHYGIPSVSWRDSYLQDWRLSEKMYDSKYLLEEMYKSNDDRHPKAETGHLLMAHLIVDEMVAMMHNYHLSHKVGLAKVELSPPLPSQPFDSLLSRPTACLPAPLNRFVLWTISSSSFCAITYLIDGRSASFSDLLRVVRNDGWHVEDKSIKHAYRPVNENQTQQIISMRSPRSFDTIAFVLVIKSWDQWANASMTLSASAESIAANPACAAAIPPPPVLVEGHWNSESTQSTGVVIWQADEDVLQSVEAGLPVRPSCMDTLTIVKLTPGEFRFIGYYAA